MCDTEGKTNPAENSEVYYIGKTFRDLVVLDTPRHFY